MEFIDALADVIASRVVAKLEVAKHPPATPDRVPLWVPGPERARGKRLPDDEGDWTAEKALRASGMIRHGEAGYQDALLNHLERQRAHEANVEARAQVRKTVRLLEKLLAPARTEPK